MMFDTMKKAAATGWRSSELWLSVLAIVLPIADRAADRAPGVAGVIGSALVAAAYAASRAWVKGKAIDGTAVPAASEAAAEHVAGDRPAPRL